MGAPAHEQPTERREDVMTFIRLFRFYRHGGLSIRNSAARAWELATRDLSPK